jgi:hypothetical protein
MHSLGDVGTIGRDPSVSKSKQIHVDTFQFYLNGIFLNASSYNGRQLAYRLGLELVMFLNSTGPSET